MMETREETFCWRKNEREGASLVQRSSSKVGKRADYQVTWARQRERSGVWCDVCFVFRLKRMPIQNSTLL